LKYEATLNIHYGLSDLKRQIDKFGLNNYFNYALEMYKLD